MVLIIWRKQMFPPFSKDSQAEEVKSAVQEYIDEKKKEREDHLGKKYTAKHPEKLARLMGYSHAPKEFDKIADKVYHYLLDLSEKTNSQSHMNQNADRDNIGINLVLFIALLTLALAMFTSALIRMIPASGKADAVPPHAADARDSEINIIGTGNAVKPQVNIGGGKPMQTDYQDIEIDIGGDAQQRTKKIDIGAFDTSGKEQFLRLKQTQEALYQNVPAFIETANKHGISIGGLGNFYENIQPAIQAATADTMRTRVGLNETYMSTALLPGEMNTLRRGASARSTAPEHPLPAFGAGVNSPVPDDPARMPRKTPSSSK